VKEHRLKPVLLGGESYEIDGGYDDGLDGLLAAFGKKIVGSVTGNGLAIDGVDNHGLGVRGEVSDRKSDSVVRAGLNFDSRPWVGEKLRRNQLIKSHALVSVLEMRSGIRLGNDGARHLAQIGGAKIAMILIDANLEKDLRIFGNGIRAAVALGQEESRAEGKEEQSEKEPVHRTSSLLFYHGAVLTAIERA
jgi:hypothetical protein